MIDFFSLSFPIHRIRGSWHDEEIVQPESYTNQTNNKVRLVEAKSLIYVAADKDTQTSSQMISTYHQTHSEVEMVREPYPAAGDCRFAADEGQEAMNQPLQHEDNGKKLVIFCRKIFCQTLTCQVTYLVI